MRTFTVERGNDESGISGTGVVMEGVEFSDGRLVIRWLTDPCSVVHWDCYPDFWRICIAGHPTNNTVVRWSDGQVDWQNGPPEHPSKGVAKGTEVSIDNPRPRQSAKAWCAENHQLVRELPLANLREVK